MPALRILGLSMVKNEQDVVEPFVRHNLQFLDHLVVIDNASSDQTRLILRQLCEELQNLTCLDDPTFGYTQSQRMTARLHEAQSQHRADFVVFLDADEFILADSRDAFEARLAGAIPSGGVGALPWRTYVLTPQTAQQAASDPPRSIQWRRAREHSVYKSILRLDGAVQTDLVVGPGAHRIWRNSRAIERPPLPDLYLAHFPIRSREQFTSKIVVSWAACLRANPHEATTGLFYQWRDNFEALARGEIADSNVLAEASLRYAANTAAIDWTNGVVLDPVPFSYERRYSTGAFADPIAIIARAWQHQLTSPN
jgi:hypothetical protein